MKLPAVVFLTVLMAIVGLPYGWQLIPTNDQALQSSSRPCISQRDLFDNDWTMSQLGRELEANWPFSEEMEARDPIHVSAIGMDPEEHSTFRRPSWAAVMMEPSSTNQSHPKFEQAGRRCGLTNSAEVDGAHLVSTRSRPLPCRRWLTTAVSS